MKIKELSYLFIAVTFSLVTTVSCSAMEHKQEMKTGKMEKTEKHMQMKKGEFKSSAVIKQVQQKLTDRGYDVGPIDGLLGPRTSKALHKFQGANNLTTTGRVNLATLDQLGIDPEMAEEWEQEAFAE